MTEFYNTQGEIQLIAFNLAQEEYCIPIMCVQEIIMPQKTTHIPRSPQFMEGVINLRGKIIPILDARKKFGIISDEAAKISEIRVIVLNVADHTIGLIVDAVSEVIHLSVSEVEPPPVDIADEDEFIYGIGKIAARLLILLDPNKLLNLQERQTLAGLTKLAQNISETIKTAEQNKATV